MRHSRVAILAVCSLFSLAPLAAVADVQSAQPEVANLIRNDIDTGGAWKGDPYLHDFEAGMLMGLGVFDGAVGYGVLFNGAKSILQEGFIDDVSDQVFLEAYLGPVILGEGTAFDYGFHGRWDFNKDRDWSFYSTAGIAGTITGESLGDAWRLYPRLSVGMFRTITEDVRLRAELSHDLITLGATYRF